MMLSFQWDSLRRGDRVLVHDPTTPHRGLRAGVVVLVDETGPRRDVAVRYTDGADTGLVVRPSRFATHSVPLTDAAECWRCAGEYQKSSGSLSAPVGATPMTAASETVSRSATSW
jgi:hypothetical protein